MLVRTETWGGDRECADQEVGGDSECTDQEVWLYAQRPGEEIVSALTRRYACTHRDLGRR